MEMNNKKQGINRKKRLILLALPLLLMFIGVLLSSANLYKFAYGYFIYKTSPDNHSVEAKTKNDPDTEKPKVNQSQDKEELYPVRPKIGEKMGKLFIPKLNATLPIYHGTNEDELAKGVGHFAGSVLPGEKDNSVLSGHRDTVFRKLGQIGINDILIVQTKAGEFQYRVNKVRIVDENDRTVIVPKPRATLTVSTCYPFDYIGSAPQRYILVAHLVKKTIN
ncbi:class D sortase [Peribacillus sp. SCS-155]|uniref:class D sortase n=1 Tax=Peribacillus sedimenti TaxID=3115297 RepID=UPI003905B1EF